MALTTQELLPSRDAAIGRPYVNPDAEGVAPMLIPIGGDLPSQVVGSTVTTTTSIRLSVALPKKERGVRSARGHCRGGQ